MENLAVVHNEAQQRYEAMVEGALAVAEYALNGNEILFHHTYVPASLRGRGVGSVIVRAALEDARARGLTIKSTCWFVSDYLRAHPEYASTSPS